MLRFARFEALAGLLLLMRGEDRLAAELDVTWPLRRSSSLVVRALSCAAICWAYSSRPCNR
jgi:hypothetical protein